MSDCIFCKIINNEIPAAIVFEDDNVIAFRDINPQAKQHIIVVPRKHIPYVSELGSDDTLNCIFTAARKIVEQEGFDKTGYRICVNNGTDAGQVVFHVHFHILGGQKLSEKMG